MKLGELASLALQAGACDVHLAAGLPPLMRLWGNLLAFDHPRLTPEDIEECVWPMLSLAQQTSYREHGQLSCSYSYPGTAHGRLCVFQQRQAMQVALRLHRWQWPSPTELGLPAVFWHLPGLWLVAGAGRTTARIAWTLRRAQDTQVVEEVGEFSYPLIVKHREIGASPQAWRAAFQVLREQRSPRVALPDLSDPWRIRGAVGLAASGCSVLAEHPAEDCTLALSALQAHSSEPTWRRLVGCLQGVLGLRLEPHHSAPGWVGVGELLRVTPQVRERLLGGLSVRAFLDHLEEGA